MNSIKSENYGTTYTSHNSDAISKVTFYDVMIDYQTYFAMSVLRKTIMDVQSIYIRVASNTKFNYSTNYLDSAGKAFWKYIQPYNETLECAPNFE